MELDLVITDSGDDGQAHWLLVEMRHPVSGQVLDRDRFRWAKQTKQVSLNPPEDPTNPPAGWIPRLSAPREANQFDYDELADISSRHFLKRQGVLPSGIGRPSGEAWSPKSISHLAVNGIERSESNNARRTKMVGARLRIGVPEFSQGLHRVMGHVGTVTTISTDFDGYHDADSGTCFDSAGTIYAGLTVAGNQLRSYLRFPLASITSTDVVSDVDFKMYYKAATFRPSLDIQAYNQDGQADPNADSCAVRFTRCADDASPYVDNDQTLNVNFFAYNTVDLGASADADVEAALGSPDRFSLGVNENSTASNYKTGWEDLENAGSNEPKIVVTHTAADESSSSSSNSSSSNSSSNSSSSSPATSSSSSSSGGDPLECYNNTPVITVDVPDESSSSSSSESSVGFSSSSSSSLSSASSPATSSSSQSQDSSSSSSSISSASSPATSSSSSSSLGTSSSSSSLSSASSPATSSSSSSSVGFSSSSSSVSSASSPATSSSSSSSVGFSSSSSSSSVTSSSSSSLDTSDSVSSLETSPSSVS